MTVPTSTKQHPMKLIMLALLAAAAMWSPRGDAHEVSHHEAYSPMETADPTVDADDVRNPDVRKLITAFRRTGDDALLDRAWTTLEPQLETASADTLLEAAVVAQARHDFDLSLQLIDRALDIRRNSDQAWLLRAAIQLVRGEIDDAARSCHELRASSLLVTVTCSARISIARGDHAGALKKLTAVLSAIDALDAASEPYAWALSVAGDAAATIDAGRAVSYYERSLMIVDSTQVRSALIDVLLAQERLADADRMLPEMKPHALALQVRRMIIERRLQQTAEHPERARDFEHTIAAADHQFRHWIAEEDWVHAREMARFYVDVLYEPELARRIARVNLTLQREREDLLLARRTGVLSHDAR